MRSARLFELSLTSWLAHAKDDMGLVEQHDMDNRPSWNTFVLTTTFDFQS